MFKGKKPSTKAISAKPDEVTKAIPAKSDSEHKKVVR